MVASPVDISGVQGKLGCSMAFLPMSLKLFYNAKLLNAHAPVTSLQRVSCGWHHISASPVDDITSARFLWKVIKTMETETQVPWRRPTSSFLIIPAVTGNTPVPFLLCSWNGLFQNRSIIPLHHTEHGGNPSFPRTPSPQALQWSPKTGYFVK